MEQRGRYAAVATIASIFLGIGGWGAEVSGVDNPALGIGLMVIGAIGFVGSILWGFWPVLRVRRMLLFSRKLRLEPRLESLSYAYPKGWAGALMEAGFAQRSFAVISVRNEWQKDLPKVVARCFIGASNEELPCFWSKEPDGKFMAGGGKAADLDVWHERLLIVAQVFAKDSTWARLPADPEYLFHTTGKSGEGHLYSAAGERLDLGKSVGITVTFRAANLRETVRFVCTFGADGPTFSRQV